MFGSDDEEEDHQALLETKCIESVPSPLSETDKMKLLAFRTPDCFVKFKEGMEVCLSSFNSNNISLPL
jgi:hypothetical protein